MERSGQSALAAFPTTTILLGAAMDIMRAQATRERAFRAHVACSVDDNALVQLVTACNYECAIHSRTPPLQCCWRDVRAHKFLQNRCSKMLISARLTQIVVRVSDFFEPSRF
jgi:hypothetical protein